MSPRLPILSFALCCAAALAVGCSAEMAAESGYDKEADQRVVVFSSAGGCLRAIDDQDGPCLDNPQNCDRIEVDYSTGMGCETCYGADGDIITSHCGDVVEADCSDLENDLGELCTICRTPNGEVLYDTCHTPTPLTGACETYTDAAGQLCELCYADNGDVVSRECFTDDYWCEDFVEAGQDCRRCYEGNSLVSESCDQGTTNPDTCTTINDPSGATCYTCVDANGEVVVHDCSTANAIGCDSYLSQDGASCTICYDVNGAVVSHECNREEPPVEECREYNSEGNICTMCFDADGNVTHRDCRPPCSDEGLVCYADSDCAGEAACIEGMCRCAPPPPCELFTTVDGTLCEICGDLNNDGFVDELDANCFPNPTDPVNCWEEERVDTASGDVIVCTVCESQGGGRTEQCGGSVTTPDVVCVVEQNSAGLVCEVCRDPFGTVVHSSCDDLMCRDEEIPSLSSDSPFVPCQICDQGEELVSLACDLQNVCMPDDTEGGTGSDPGGSNTDPDPNPPQPGDPTTAADACGNVWMSREPLQCSNTPWELWWAEDGNMVNYSPAQEGELIRLYYASTQQPPIAILAYVIENAFDVDYCTSCDCPRGDIISIYVSAVDAQRLQALGWRYVW